jgi:hypothetical protein
MLYNIYLRTSSSRSNLFAANADDLTVICRAYEEGSSGFYVAGKKYSLSHFQELKIFTLNDKAEFEAFLNSGVGKSHMFPRLKGAHLPPSELREFGEDVTRQFIHGGFGEKVKPATVFKDINAKNDMLIFISHSSSDAEIAKALIALIRSAFNIPTKDIRCTSVSGHKLAVGVLTDEELKREIFGCNVFIALITNSSVKSPYVLFELGARWGSGQPLFPLIADPSGTALLGGPLKNINALSLTDSSDVHQFVNDLGKTLSIAAESPAVYSDAIDKVKLLSMINSTQTTPTEPATNKLGSLSTALSAEASELLIKASMDLNGHFVVIGYKGGLFTVEVDGRELMEDQGGRTVAKWRSAVDQLVKLNLAHPLKPGGEIYGLTSKGYEMADQLKSS